MVTTLKKGTKKEHIRKILERLIREKQFKGLISINFSANSF